MSEYVGNLVSSLRAGAQLSPNEAARAVLPLAEAIANEHAHGQVRGSLSPIYVPPEIHDGLEPTAASDVWSVGALLFHSMAGHAPFDHSPEPPARLRRAGWLGPLVEMALAHDPAQRPAMTEVAAYLRAREPVTPAGVPEPTVPLPAPPPTPLIEEVAATAAIAMDGAPRDRRTAMLAVVLAAVVLILVLVTGILVLGHGGRRGPAAAAPGTVPHRSASSSSPTGATKPPHHHPRRPTARAMTSFARTYVATASSDPGAGFAMLTPAYQQASPRYRQFWDSVRDPRVLRASARPQAMTVTYTYRYRFGRQRRTETVTLDLVRENGRLLISGAR